MPCRAPAIGPMTPHSALLPALSPDDLLAIVDHLSLTVPDRLARAGLVDAEVEVEVKAARIAETLQTFSRDRLKERCRTMGLDDSGREWGGIVARPMGDCVGAAGASPPPGEHGPSRGSSPRSQPLGALPNATSSSTDGSPAESSCTKNPTHLDGRLIKTNARTSNHP